MLFIRWSPFSTKVKYVPLFGMQSGDFSRFLAIILIKKSHHEGCNVFDAKFYDVELTGRSAERLTPLMIESRVNIVIK